MNDIKNYFDLKKTSDLSLTEARLIAWDLGGNHKRALRLCITALEAQQKQINNIARKLFFGRRKKSKGVKS